MTKARYIMLGGFLGAGKTTAVARLAQHLSAQGKRVGLITNDQGRGLVDTAMLSSRGFEVEEIAGGCFCSARLCSRLALARRLHSLSGPARSWRLAQRPRPQRPARRRRSTWVVS